MKHLNQSISFVVLASALLACAPQVTAVESTATQPESTATVAATVTNTSTALPTETSSPTDLPPATPATCAVPTNPIDSATIPASGPFDFTWAAFDGAASYIISIGPKDWFPTNFPITGTTLTRYMENFPASPAYEWSITALDSSGRELCKTASFIFTTSVAQYATPSFAGSEIFIQPTSEASSSGSNPPANPVNNNPFVVSLQSVEEVSCYLTFTFSVPSAYPVNYSVLRYTLDPAEANSPDFCNWGQAIGLTSNTPGIYQGAFNLPNFPYLKNGDTVYLMAKFRYNQAIVACSQLIQYTLNTGCSGE